MEETFLVFASLMDFLPKEKKPLFIGPEALLSDGNEKQRKFNLENADILPDPYEGEHSTQKAYEVVLKTQEKMLELLTLVLNEYHGQIHSTRYWRMLLGEWPAQYLSLLYDHYLRLKTIKEKKISFETYVLDPISYYVPVDSQEFCELARGPQYNLQLYSKILRFWGMKFPTRTLKVKEERERSRPSEGPIDNFLLGITDSPFFRNPFAKIFLYRPPWSAWKGIELFWKTKGEIGLGTAPTRRIELTIKDRSTTREKLKEKIHFKDEFELLAASLMIDDLPLSFLEGLRTLRAQSQHINAFGPEYIMASKALAFDDVFKFWIAGKVEESNTLMVLQEDLTDTVLACHLRREHQLKIADYYLTCSELYAQNQSKAISVPQPRVMGSAPLSFNENLQKILYLSVPQMQYLHPFPMTSYQVERALTRQDKLIEAFPPNLFSHLQVRFLDEDVGKERRRRLLKVRANLAFDQIPDFLQSVKDARLIIFGDFSAEAIETLYLNRPVLFVWPKETFVYHPDLVSLFDSLHAAGIWFHSEAELGAFLEANYEHIHQWWAEPERQKLVIEVLSALCQIGADPTQVWVQKLSSIKKKKVR